MTRYTVIGAGAVGLLYGARLAEAGHEVGWLLRGGADEVLARGITVRTEGRTIHLPPRSLVASTDPRTLPAPDVVLVATKTTANATLAETVAPSCPPGAAVALFQNGLGAEATVRAGVPDAGAVVAGLCFVCANRTAPGEAVHLDYGAVTLAPLGDHDGDGGVARRIAGDLADAGFETDVLDDLVAARWRKLAWNIPFNGLCTVLRARTDEVLAVPATRDLAGALMDEVVAGAAAVGHPLEDGLRARLLAMTDAMASYDPSMKLDHEAGRPLEITAIYDEACRAARAAGAPMVRAEALAAQLRLLDPARAGTGSGTAADAAVGSGT